MGKIIQRNDQKQHYDHYDQRCDECRIRRSLVLVAHKNRDCKNANPRKKSYADCRNSAGNQDNGRKQNQKIEEEKGKQEMESKRDILRVIEKEIKKGSAPVAFAGLGFSEECYHLVDSQAKMNQLLDYFFRNEEYAALTDRQVKSNIYAEMGKRLNFRSARSDRDRKNMEVAAKRWIKKKHPTFDGDVYVENIRCFLDISQEELEKRKCTVNEQDIAALIFSQKHLEALYLQCLMHRRNAMQEVPELKGLSETCNRIYKLQDVDVLFQCLLMDQMDWEEEKLYVQFSTIYLLKQTVKN